MTSAYHGAGFAELARSSLRVQPMNRYAIVVLGALLGLAGAWALVPRPAPEMHASGFAPAGSRPAPATVRVQQQLVTAHVTAERRPAAHKKTMNAGRGSQRKPGFFAKARRVLFGEGRHKPSPFPGAQ